MKSCKNEFLKNYYYESIRYCTSPAYKQSANFFNFLDKLYKSGKITDEECDKIVDLLTCVVDKSIQIVADCPFVELRISK